MKNLIKIVFIGLVILGLVASYMNLGGSVATSQPNQQASARDNFQGPTSAPSTNGPTNVPPGQ